MRRWIVNLLVTVLAVFVAMPAFCAEIPLDDKSTVDQVLDALHARGVGLKDFTAEVALADIDSLTGDTTTIRGKAWYQDTGDGNSRVRVSFSSKVISGNSPKPYKQDYLLQDGWLIDRDYKQKIEAHRQVLQPGQKANPLKLGEGPFPLPIGQPREEVLKLFEVKRVEPKKEDPDKTAHVELTPKPHSQFERKFKKIDVWVDQQSNFPRRIGTVDRNDRSTRQTDLTDIKVNGGLTDKDFALDPISNDWTKTSEALK